MSQTTIQNTMFLEERDHRVDDVLVKTVGPAICTFLVRVIKVSELFQGDHNQVSVAAREFTQWLAKQFEETREEQLTLQITDRNLFLNGQLLKLDARAYQRATEIRKAFASYSVNQIAIGKGVGPAEVIALVQALNDVKSGRLDTLQLFSQPNLHLASVAENDFDLPDVDDRRELIELYAGLMVKVQIYFNRLSRGSTPTSRHIKRVVQKIADELGDRGDVFVGLINLRLVRGQDFVHASNTCIYSMLLGQAIGLGAVDIVRCGMTALTQNIERLRNPALDEGLYAQGDATHFQTNLSSVVALSEIGGGDVLSALRLVTSYERGFPFHKPLPDEWYREDLAPHLLSRIIEIGRHYDVLTHGLEGVSGKSPDRALQILMSKMGSQYDPNLVRIFVNVVGIYPVGSVVELSTGDRALVVRSPSLISDHRLSNASRPTVRMLDGSDRVVDLAQPKYSTVRIQRIVEGESANARPGALFLF